MPDRPTGPEDETPGSEFTLTRDQFDELYAVVPKKHLAIRLRDRGAAWVEAQMLDAEGNVQRSWTLGPVRAKESHRSRLRWLRQLREQEQPERAESEQD
jgi:hypothetical protein